MTSHIAIARLLHGSWSLAFVLLGLVAAGCGECVFQAQAKGVVQDIRGQPLQGVKVLACDSESPPGSNTNPCRSTFTDAAGQFSIESSMYRPGALQCAVHSVWFEKRGCRSTRQTFAQPPDELTVTLPCGDSPPAGVEPIVRPVSVAGPGKGVQVLVDAKDWHLALEGQDRVGWQHICTTPCDVTLDPSLPYRIRGKSIYTSEPFRVPATKEPILVDVSPASKRDAALGSSFALPGIMLATAGGVMVLAGALMNETTEDGQDQTDTKRVLRSAGLVTLSVGVAASVVGFAIGGGNQDTNVEVKSRTVKGAGVSVTPSGIAF